MSLIDILILFGLALIIFLIVFFNIKSHKENSSPCSKCPYCKNCNKQPESKNCDNKKKNNQ